MVSIFASLNDSLIALISYPKLFVPKIFLAILWGFILLFLIDLFAMLAVNPMDIVVVNFVASQLPVLVFFFLFVFLIDVIINASYPLMVRDLLEKKQISVVVSLKEVFGNLFSFIIPIIVAFFIGLAVFVPFVFLLSFSIITQNTGLIIVSLIVSLIVLFVVSVIFYFVFPVIVLEKSGLSGVLDTIKIGWHNFRQASFGVLITFILSVLTAVIAFFFGFSSGVGIFAIFVFFLLRIFTAFSATYQIVLNPVLYLKYLKK